MAGFGWRARCFAGLLAALALSACADHDATVRVELDIFSGRPNPAWDLTPAQADELRRMTGALPVATSKPPEAPGLGYRGFILSGGQPQKAFEGFVWNTAKDIRQDAARKIERWLVDSAGSHLPPELKRAVPLP